METLPPGPSAPALVQLARWSTRPLPFLDECGARFGDVFTVRWPGQPPVVMFSHPDAVRDIFTGSPDDLYAGAGNRVLELILGRHSLLLLDGPEHLRERKLLMPPFHGERMQTYATVMQAITDAAIDRWPRGRAFPIHKEMQAVTLEVILRTVFGIDEAARLSRLGGLLAEVLERGSHPAMLGMMIGVPHGRLRGVLGFGVDREKPWAQWQKNLAEVLPWSGLVRAIAAADEALYAEIARRRAAGTEGREDVLSLLMDARDEAGAAMTDQELRDELVTLLMAGHETTATTLAWAVHRVMSHPEVLAKIHHELAEVMGEEFQPALLGKLDYLDGVVKETLRLTPIVPIVVRQLQRPLTLGGVALDKGVIVAPAIPLLHRRADVWGDPEAFRPERFLERKPSPYEFLPFGGSVRRCLGMAFALYEMKVVLARIFQRLALRPGDDRPIVPVRRSITVAPSHGVPVVVEDRRASVVEDRRA